MAHLKKSCFKSWATIACLDGSLRWRQSHSGWELVWCWFFPSVSSPLNFWHSEMLQLLYPFRHNRLVALLTGRFNWSKAWDGVVSGYFWQAGPSASHQWVKAFIKGCRHFRGEEKSLELANCVHTGWLYIRFDGINSSNSKNEQRQEAIKKLSYSWTMPWQTWHKCLWRTQKEHVESVAVFHVAPSTVCFETCTMSMQLCSSARGKADLKLCVCSWKFSISFWNDRKMMEQIE